MGEFQFCKEESLEVDGADGCTVYVTPLSLVRPVHFLLCLFDRNKKMEEKSEIWTQASTWVRPEDIH